MIKSIRICHQKKALALAIGCVLSSVMASAQDQVSDELAALEDELVVGQGILLEEVVVFGVRASQAKAIDIKRSATNIVDSIVAEDIGKLPDLTITDSLQRITGVQITREANEGTSLNIRGMPQVLTTLNGEQFLSPWSITEVGANYSDIPAGMISGADIHKSASSSMLAGGISGVVDLKTFRPTELDSGWIGSLKVEASQGEQSDFEYDLDGSTSSRTPDGNLSAFFGYNHNDRWGFALGAFTSDTYAANYQMRVDDLRLAFLDEPGGTPGDPKDINGDGDLVNDWYLVAGEYAAESSFMEREREGVSFTFDANINEFFSVKGDLFYTKMDQYDRGVQGSYKARSSALAYLEDRRYILDGEYIYVDAGNPVPAGAIDAYGIQEEEGLNNVLQSDSLLGSGHTIRYVDADGNVQTPTLYSVVSPHIISPEFQTQSTNEINRTAAVNGSIQVEYTNQENLELTFRYVKAEAEHQLRQAVLEQGSPAWQWFDYDFNNRKDRLHQFDVVIDYRGDVPVIYNSDNLSDPDLLQYYQGRATGETTDAKLDVFRFDGEYFFNFSDNFESLSFGLRHGVRDADHMTFKYITPTARYSTWEDPRVATEDQFRLIEGNGVWEQIPVWRRYDYELEDSRLIDPNIGGLEDNGFGRNSVVSFTDFGPISRLNMDGTPSSGIAALSPAVWDSPLEFMNRLYPGTRTIVDPSFNYSVEETSLSSFIQLNFKNDEGLWGIPFQGNLGIRVVKTDREVTRSVIPDVLTSSNSLGYSTFQRIAYVYDTETIDHSYTDVLPSLNVNFYPSDEVIARLGLGRTTSRNDLNNVGSTLSLVWYDRCNKTYIDEDGVERIMYSQTPTGDLLPEEVSCVASGSQRGDPYIEPWVADVINTSVEWYFDENALLSAGLFLIKVDSSVETVQEQQSFLDADGIDRGRVANVLVSRNVGASDLYGLEVGYKQPWNFTDIPVINNMGVEFNYTYSESSSNDRDIEGKAFPLPSNSKHQTNFILWYDDDALNVRLAYNWRSKEFLGRATVNTNETPLSMGNWLEPTGYLDLSINYWWNDHFGVFMNGTNLTETHRKSYTQYSDQFNSIWAQERRYALGFTVKL